MQFSLNFDTITVPLLHASAILNNKCPIKHFCIKNDIFSIVWKLKQTNLSLEIAKKGSLTGKTRNPNH